MSYDQKQFLDLLLEYRSDETRKARRNVSLIAFVILAVPLLGNRLTDINAFGLSLDRSSSLSVLLLAFVLLVYWTVMFSFARLHDREIQKERALLLEQDIAPRIRLLDQIETAKRDNKFAPSDYSDAKGYVDAYRSQQERTKKATAFGRIIRDLEIVVPLGLAVAAFIVLACWFYNAI